MTLKRLSPLSVLLGSLITILGLVLIINVQAFTQAEEKQENETSVEEILAVSNDDIRIQPAAIPEPAPFGGNFRMMCDLSHTNNDDPIVFPGEVGRSHTHKYYGNGSADAFSTTESLKAATEATCHGGTLNKTAYWVPALLDGNGNEVDADFFNIYYKSGFLNEKTIEPPPEGLRMIAGDHSATFLKPQSKHVAHWICLSEIDSVTNEDDFYHYIPNCAEGDTLVLSIIFPQCWDGVNLDSADHKSHLIHPTEGSCPSSHPVPLPEITYSLDWIVKDSNGTADWKLVSDHYDTQTYPGGASAHGDWWMAWDQNTVETFVKHCINGGLDCSNGNLGNGTELVFRPSGPNESPAPEPAPTPSPKPEPIPQPEPDPKPTPKPTSDIYQLKNDWAYITWNVPENMGLNGGTMMVFSNKPNPTKEEDTAYYRPGNGPQDAWIGWEYGGFGQHYVRICEYSEIDDSCTNYSKELQINL